MWADATGARPHGQIPGQVKPAARSVAEMEIFSACFVFAQSPILITLRLVSFIVR